MNKFVLIGPPGSGKGTQAAQLRGFFNIPHISSGDVLRNEVKKGTDFGNQIKVFMDKGEIGPVELITEVIVHHLDAHCQNGFILDGFPRTVYQAEQLANRHVINAAFFINVPEDEIVVRITGRRICVCGNIYHIVFNPPQQANFCACGKELIIRTDDNEATVHTRIGIFNEETRPVIDFYKNAGILHTIDGVNGPEEIFTEIKKRIN